MFVFMFKQYPETPAKTAFFSGTVKDETLCRYGANYFTDMNPYAGPLQNKTTAIWILHNDVIAAAQNKFPSLKRVLALAKTVVAPRALTHGIIIKLLCATVLSKELQRGSGRILYDIICSHAGAVDCTFVKLHPAVDELYAVYTRFGMVCTGKADDGFCEAALPREDIPELHVPFETSVPIDAFLPHPTHVTLHAI